MIVKADDGPSGANCGTGHGGFKPGNTCGKEDGAGGGKPTGKPRTPAAKKKEAAAARKKKQAAAKAKREAAKKKVAAARKKKAEAAKKKREAAKKKAAAAKVRKAKQAAAAKARVEKQAKQKAERAAKKEALAKERAAKREVAKKEREKTKEDKVKQPAVKKMPNGVSVSHSAGTSEAFRKNTEQAASEISPKAAALLEKHGVTVHGAGSVVGDIGRLKGQKPRGWESGMTWEQADGVYEPSTKRAVVAQSHTNKSGDVVSFGEPTKYGQSLPPKLRAKLEEVEATRLRAVAMHEAGHAFDDAAGSIRHSREFAEAHAKDMAAHTAEQAQRYSYMRQSGEAGRSETVAEGFAAHHNYGVIGDAEEFRKAFPNSMAVLEKHLK